MNVQQRTIAASILIVTVSLICGCDKKNDTDRTEPGSEKSIDSRRPQSPEIASTRANELGLEDQVTTKRFLIKPDVGMGMLCFGDDSSKIEEFVGIPESAQGGVFFVYPGFMVVAQGGKVYKIICVDDKGSNGGYKCPCRTLKGIAIGSTEQAVIQAYGQPNTKLHDSSQYSGATQWLYREKGMTELPYPELRPGAQARCVTRQAHS